MTIKFARVAGITWIVVMFDVFAFANQISSTTAAPPLAKRTFTFVGCVKNVLSDKPWASIQDTQTGTTYPITNFSLKDYGGRKVSIVVTLQPSPTLAGQLSSLDRSRLIILAGGTATNVPPSSPTAHVVKLRTLEACPE
jgi:hypothetical protein